MVVAKNSSRAYAYTSYGNTAYDYKEYNNDVEKDKKDKKNTRHESKTRFRKQFKLVVAVVLMLCTGMLIVGRYVLVMNLSNQSIQYKQAIADNQKRNDELKIQLMKYDDIKQIEKIATSELNMVRPDSSNIVHLNMAQADNGSKVASVGQAQKHEEGFINRIISFFN